MKDMIGMNDGTVLVNVHTVEQCGGNPCVVHNPSQHHMTTWAPGWDGHYKMVLRTCAHGFVHPDPDDVWFRRQRDAPRDRESLVHPCDCCCQPPLEPGQKAIGS